MRALIDASLRSEVRGELKMETSPGQKRLVRLSLSPVNDFGVLTICVVATDLTELSGANEALTASEERLRNLSGRLLRHHRASPSAALDKVATLSAHTDRNAGQCQPDQSVSQSR